MRTMKKRIVGVLVLAAMLILALALSACEGPEGPMGPEGPQGPAGGTDPNCEHLWWTSWAATETKTCTTGEDKRVCQGCLKRETRINPLGHTVANLIMSTQPTETIDGQGSFDCTRVGCTTPTGNSVTIPAWNKFYGTWKENNPTDSLTISKTEIIYTVLSDNKKSTYEILSWTPSTMVGDYPAGYTIARKLTALENGASGTIGNESTLTLYMHTTNTSSFQWYTGSSNYTYFKVTE